MERCWECGALRALSEPRRLHLPPSDPTAVAPTPVDDPSLAERGREGGAAFVSLPLANPRSTRSPLCLSRTFDFGRTRPVSARSPTLGLSLVAAVPGSGWRTHSRIVRTSQITPRMNPGLPVPASNVQT